MNTSDIWDKLQSETFKVKLRELVLSGKASQDQMQTYAFHLILSQEAANVFEAMKILEDLFHITRDPTIVRYNLLSQDLIIFLKQCDDQIRLARIASYAVQALMFGDIGTMRQGMSWDWHGLYADMWSTQQRIMMDLYLSHRCLTFALGLHQDGEVLHVKAANDLSKLVSSYLLGQYDPQSSIQLIKPNYQRVRCLLQLAYQYNHPDLLIELAELLDGNSTRFDTAIKSDPSWLLSFEVTAQQCKNKIKYLEL